MLHDLLLQIRIVCQNLFQPDFQIVDAGRQGFHNTANAVDQLRDQHGNEADHHSYQQKQACQRTQKTSQPFPAFFLCNDLFCHFHDGCLYPVIHRIQQIGKDSAVDHGCKNIRDFCSQRCHQRPAHDHKHCRDQKQQHGQSCHTPVYVGAVLIILHVH